MSRLYATFNPAAHGAGLALDQSNTVLVLPAALTFSQTARILYGKLGGQSNAEFMVWGPGTLANKSSVGVVNSTASNSTYVGGDAGGYGYRIAEGKIVNNGANIATVTAGAKGDIVEVILVLDGTGAGSVTWKLNGEDLYTQALTAETWEGAATIAGVAAGDLSCFVNCGQREFEHATTRSGWYIDTPDLPTLRAANQDYMTAPTDDLPNVAFDSVIAGNQSFAIARELSFPVWGKGSTAASACTITLQNPKGALDWMLLNDMRDSQVKLEKVEKGAPYSTVQPVASLVIDKVEGPDESTLKLTLKDSIILFDAPLQKRLILPNAEKNAANQPWPICLGAPRSTSPVLLDDVNLVYAIGDIAITGLGYVRDKGDPLDPNASPPDYTISADRRKMMMHDQPQGKVTADFSTVGGGTEPTSAADIWSGKGKPFTGTVGSGPTGWTAGGSTPAPKMLTGNRCQFQHSGQGLKIAGAKMLAGRSYRFNFQVENVSGYAGGGLGYPPATYMRIGLAKTPAHIDYMAGMLCAIAGVVGTYSMIVTNTSASDIEPYLYMYSYGATSTANFKNCELLEIPDSYSPASLVPIKLAEAMDEIMRRAGRTADQYSRDDCVAIDTASGYTGIGFNAVNPITARQALDAILPSWTVCAWQNRAGVIRFTRLEAPEDLPAIDTLVDADFLGDMKFVADDAPGLTTQWSCLKNWEVLNDSDFVTDFIDVPPAVRRALSRDYQYTVASAVRLSASYARAVFADPQGTLLDSAANAQTEGDRVCTIFKKQRGFYTRDVPHRQLELGEVYTVKHKRYGLDAGKNLMVVRIIERPDDDTATVTFWG